MEEIIQKNEKEIVLDNRLYNAQKMVESIEGELYTKEKNLDKIDQLEYGLINIKRSLNKCIELCNKSIKQKKLNERLNYASEENNSKFSNIDSIFDEDRLKIRKEINDLYNKKEESLRIIKEELEKEDKINNDNIVQNNEEKEENNQ